MPKGKHDRLPAIMQRQILNAVDAGDGDYEVRRLRELLAKDEGDLPIRLALADLYEKRSFPELSLEHFRFASGKFPHSDEVQLRLAKSLSRLGQVNEAADRLESYLNVHPSPKASLPCMLGILRDRSGQYKKGEAAHRRALDIDPSQETLHSNLGYNLYLQERIGEAVAEYRRAIELNPKSEFARNNLGLALAARPEKSGDALAQFRTAGDPAVAHNNVAVQLMKQKRYAEARVELEKALGYRKDLPEIWANMKAVAEADGKPIVLTVADAQGKPNVFQRMGQGLKRAFVTEETVRSDTRRGAGIESGGR